MTKINLSIISISIRVYQQKVSAECDRRRPDTSRRGATAARLKIVAGRTIPRFSLSVRASISVSIC